MLTNGTVKSIIEAASRRPLSPIEQDVLAWSLAGDADELAKASEHWERVNANLERARRVEMTRKIPQVVIGGRQHGKTHRLAQWVKEGRRWRPDGTFTNDRVIVTVQPDQARRHLMHDHDLGKNEVLTMHQVTRRGASLRPEIEYAVDDIDLGRIVANVLGQHHAPALIAVDAPSEFANTQ